MASQPTSNTSKSITSATPSESENKQSDIFLTTYAHVLLLVATSADISDQELASRTGVDLIAVQKIIEELVQSNYLIKRQANGNVRYHLNPDLPLPDGAVAHRTVEDLVKFASCAD